jgi:hypothetical protein
LFYRIRRRSQIRLAPPPVKPQLTHGAWPQESRAQHVAHAGS